MMCPQEPGDANYRIREKLGGGSMDVVKERVAGIGSAGSDGSLEGSNRVFRLVEYFKYGCELCNV